MARAKDSQQYQGASIHDAAIQAQQAHE